MLGGERFGRGDVGGAFEVSFFFAYEACDGLGEACETFWCAVSRVCWRGLWCVRLVSVRLCDMEAPLSLSFLCSPHNVFERKVRVEVGLLWSIVRE